MGFSLLGLIMALAVLAPNLLLVWFPPLSPMPEARVPRLLGWLERAGQALCLVVPPITEPGELVGWWAVPALAALAGYYALWARYLATGRAGETLYRRWWVIPVPMAVLPVVVFLSTAAWLGNLWIAAAALVLAAGHIPASLIIARRVQPATGRTVPR
ncbi:hypothetical protein [Leifsonia sp. PS1209]|uniref:hypothetical protein n=1 Tax=Leifsonia sp. PS1209 TaxID=2724914 RepID=UPI001442C377|nr:hypothetical protein [Leifsonia sp. PS1209]QIZ99800.1 hypothetical protein HF024_15645 [Leifsonia sp. PS1209]